MATRQTAHQHFEQPCVICRAQGVVAVHEVDFELAKACFGNCSVGGNVHRLAGIIEIGEKDIELIQRADRQRFRSLPAFARARGNRDLKLATGIVDQKKLKLHRDAGRQAAGLVAFNHGSQGVTGVAFIGRSVFMKHPNGQKGSGRFEPRHRDKASIGRTQNAIAVAGFKHQRTVVDIFAPDIQVQNRKRKARAIFDNLIRKARRDPFATGLAVQVTGRDADCSDLGIFAKIVLDGRVGHWWLV